MKVSVVVTRKGNLRNGLDAYERRLEARVIAGMIESGRTLLTESHKLAPMDTTSMVQSSGVRHEGQGFDTQVVVFYGKKGFETTSFSPNENRIVHRIPFDYAVRIHEGFMMYPPISGVIEFLRKPSLEKQSELRQALNSFLK